MKAWLLAAVMLPAAAAAAELDAPAPATLGALATRIDLALPGLAAGNLVVPGLAPLSQAEAARLRLPPSAAPFPAAWNPAKAAVLLERARAQGALPVAAAGPAQAAGGAKPLLESINAVLTDFSPQELRKLPAEQLSALVGAIMDQGGPASPRSLPAAAILAQKRAEVIRGRMAAEPLMDQPYPNVLDGHEMPRYTREVPATARFLKAPYPVMRHYLTEEQRAQAIERGALGNAVLPYVRRTHGVWHDYYETLTGVFLTLPGVRPEQVGVREHKTSFLDLAISETLPLLELEPGRIYLIPLPGMTEGWVTELYRKWIAGDAGALSYHGQLPRLEALGGPGPALQIPVAFASMAP